MGLPVGRLVICANENDVLHRFLKTGSYTKITSKLTIAPSMDISVSSNFERYLYYLSGRNAGKLADWMKVFESTGELSLPDELIQTARSEFASHASSESDIVEAMTSIWESENYLVCPHTATAVVAVRVLGMEPEKTVCLATAHPAKFEEAVTKALIGKTIPSRPPQLEVLFSLPTRTTALSNSLVAVQGFVRMKLSNSLNLCGIPITSSNAIVALGVAVLVSFLFTRRSGR